MIFDVDTFNEDKHNLVDTDTGEELHFIKRIDNIVIFAPKAPIDKTIENKLDQTRVTLLHCMLSASHDVDRIKMYQKQNKVFYIVIDGDVTFYKLKPKLNNTHYVLEVTLKLDDVKIDKIVCIDSPGENHVPFESCYYRTGLFNKELYPFNKKATGKATIVYNSSDTIEPCEYIITHSDGKSDYTSMVYSDYLELNYNMTYRKDVVVNIPIDKIKLVPVGIDCDDWFSVLIRVSLNVNKGLVSWDTVLQDYQYV